MRHALCLAALGAVLSHGAARADGLSVCIDTSNPAAGRDRLVAEAVAHQEGASLTVHAFDGSGAGDDDGLSAKDFRAIMADHCQVVMGFPVDATNGEPPGGLMATAPYDQTGFVVVLARPGLSGGLADFPAGTEVAVTYGTAPNLYFLDHHNVAPDIHLSDQETLQTVMDGQDKAAMVWQATLTDYLARKPDAPVTYQTLNEPHDRWNIVGLYQPEAADAAARFGAALAALKASGVLAHLVAPQKKAALDLRSLIAPAAYVTGDGSGGGGGLPALYTDAQAKAGAQKFSDNCAQCHGDHLEGMAGPALKGANFASDKAAFSVGDVFTILANNMPATQPGSLAHEDYEQIMAFLLQQNGYPAGQAALQYATAMTSKVPLRYHGK